MRSSFTHISFSLVLLLIMILGTHISVSAQVGINGDGSSADASSMLDVKATDKGMLIPRLTSTQRDNISSPATGLMIYNSTNSQFEFYDGSSWGGVASYTRNNSTISANTTLTGTDDLTAHITGAYDIYLPASPAQGQTITLITDNASARVYGNGNTLRDGTWTGTDSNFTEAGTNKYIFVLTYAGSIWHFVVIK